MEFTFRHEVVFTNKRDVSVSDVAYSLLANEQLVQSVGNILEYCFEGLVIEKINIGFKGATTQSPLKEALAAGILFTFQDDLKREIPKMIETITGHHVDDRYSTVVTVIFLVVVIYGIELAWDMFKNSRKGVEKQTVDPQISGNFNTLIQVGGNLIGVPPSV